MGGDSGEEVEGEHLEWSEMEFMRLLRIKHKGWAS